MKFKIIIISNSNLEIKYLYRTKKLKINNQITKIHNNNIEIRLKMILMKILIIDILKDITL